MTVPKRSKGAVALARLGLTNERIAARVGVDQCTVSMWTRGERRPGKALRGKLLLAYRIPEEAWDEEPEAPPPAVAELLPPTASTTAPQARTIETLALELGDKIRALHDSVNVGAADSTPEEKVRILKGCATTLTLLGRLTGEIGDISESKLASTMAWARFKQRLLVVLRRYPEAVSELVKSEEWKDA